MIYVIPDRNILVKGFLDHASMYKEQSLQWKAQSFVPCPNILDCFVEDEIGYLVMERIDGKSLYELYGSDPDTIPAPIWKQIRSIVSKLYYKNIHYVDITPYNFLMDTAGTIHIIDFGDAYECTVNWFLKDFLDGENAWNSDFA